MVALAAPAVEVHFPIGGNLPLGTGDRSRLPVNVKGREIVACGLFGLPTDVAAQRADEIDLMLAPALCQQTGVDVGGINEMSGGQQVPVRQRRMDGTCHLEVRYRCGVVRTLTMIWGSSGSQVSDRCAL